MTPDSPLHEPELPTHDKSTRRAWASRERPPNAVINVTRHSIRFHDDGILGPNYATASCDDEMFVEGYAGPGPSTPTAKNVFSISTSELPMTFYAEEPEFGHRENFEDAADDMVLENGQDALRVAYGQRHNLVLDSTAPHLAPHIVITPPDKNIQDYYTPWFNATSPQWPSHLMVTMPANAMDYTLARVPSVRLPRPDNDAPVRDAKAVFCLSKFKAFVASTTHERVHMENMTNVLQKHHRKLAAFAASEVGRRRRRYGTCDAYVCPSEKPFRWTDPAEPLLRQLNQYRGSIVIESPCPFTVPHIIINEPPPQDPWIPWRNATTNPQDRGYGRYLTVPHRLVWHVHVSTDDDDMDDTDDFYPSSSIDESDLSCQEDMNSYSSGSSSSESEPETPDPDSLMDEFLLEDEDEEDEDEDEDMGSGVHFFDSCDDSPWSGIINRFSAKVVTFANEEEDELPPFDDWYQSIAARTLVTMTA